MAEQQPFKVGKWSAEEVASLRSSWLAAMRKTKDGLGGKGRRPKGFWTGLYEEAGINRSIGAVRSKARKMEDDLRVDANCELRGIAPDRPWLDDNEDEIILAVTERTWVEKGEEHGEKDWRTVWENLGRTRYISAIKLRWRNLLVVQEERVLLRMKNDPSLDDEATPPPAVPPAPQRRPRSPLTLDLPTASKRVCVKAEEGGEREDSFNSHASAAKSVVNAPPFVSDPPATSIANPSSAAFLPPPRATYIPDPSPFHSSASTTTHSAAHVLPLVADPTTAVSSSTVHLSAPLNSPHPHASPSPPSSLNLPLRDKGKGRAFSPPPTSEQPTSSSSGVADGGNSASTDIALLRRQLAEREEMIQTLVQMLAVQGTVPTAAGPSSSGQ